ncbi:MAG: hypothetical protein WBJ33_03620 [Candidatus Nanopelagicales bacterium]
MVIKNLARILTPVLVLSLLPMINGSAANAANPPSVTIGSKQLVNELPFVDPIYVGYKGPTSFIPAAVAKKKDKFGCILRQRMIIDLATKKPKVSKGCKMKGGVWTTALGAKVTKPSKLIIAPVMPYKDAWGQGAFAWTPEQRLAWATNTKVSSSKTRARAVTNLQVTQTLVSRAESANIRSLTSRVEFFENALESMPTYTNAVIEDLCQPWSPICAFGVALRLSNTAVRWDEDMKRDAAAISEERCELMIQLASNVTAWGLSVSPQSLELMQDVNNDCPATLAGIVLYAQLNGINPVQPTTTVPTELGAGAFGGGTGGSAASGAVQLFSDYPAASSGVAVPSDAFGVHAPVDWGTPGVGASWVRLWDAGVSWAQMEPTQGNIDFSKLRASIESAERSGARVLYVLGDTPGWANGGRPGNFAPTTGSALNFIGALKNEFGSRIGAYEVWNEGNLQTYWIGSQQQLAELTKGIKDVIGDTSMVLAASTGTRATNAFVTNYGDYLDSLKALGWPVDGYTVHSYPVASAGPVERVGELGQFKTMLALRGAPVKPIWDTEVNYGLAGLGEGRRVIDDSTGAAYIAQSFIQSIQYGIDTTYWYMWTGTRGDEPILGTQLNPSTPISNTVWNNLRGMLNGSRMTRCAESDDVGFACQFAPGGGAPFTLMWTRAGTSQVNVSGIGTQVCDLLGNACTPVTNNTVTIGMLPVRVS